LSYLKVSDKIYLYGGWRKKYSQHTHCVLFFYIYISTANIKTVMCGYNGWPCGGCWVWVSCGNGKGYIFLSNAPPLRALRSEAWQFLVSGPRVSTRNVNVKQLNETTEWSRMLQVRNNNDLLKRQIFQHYSSVILTNITWAKVIIIWVPVNIILHWYWVEVLSDYKNYLQFLFLKAFGLI